MKKQRSTPGLSSVLSHLFSFALCMASLYQGACTAFWPDLAVPVVLPALPPAWSGADGWELDWRSMAMVGPVLFAAPGDTLILFLPRTSFAAIRCRPVFGSCRGLPYGTIWPLDAGAPVSGDVAADPERVLSPDARGGLAAELAFCLYQGGWDAACFNLRRFAGEAELRMTDPWDSDLAAQAIAVAEGRFRADYLRTPDKTLVGVSGLLGDMASGSPWGETIKPGAQGQATLAVSPGVHRWFGCTQELVVSVSSDGSSEWILRGTDGRVMQKVLP